VGAGQTAAWRRDRFRVLLLCCLLLKYQNCPPSQIQDSIVFIGKVLLGFQTSPSTFPFFSFPLFFVNFDFSYFSCIFESEQYQRGLNEENQ
jgi:hypothetical protein